jgi:hypothetical protein
MRTSLRVLAVAAVAAVPAIPALAAQPSGLPEKPADKTCKPAPRAGVAFIIRGTLDGDASADSLSVKVTGGNRFGKHWTKDVREAGTPIMVKIGECTKIKKITLAKRVRNEGWTKLNDGDRVLIQFRARVKEVPTLDDLLMTSPLRIVELRNKR